MQVKTRISTHPIAEELNMKSNEIFKILMAIAAFQVHCTELLNNNNKSAHFKRDPLDSKINSFENQKDWN